MSEYVHKAYNRESKKEVHMDDDYDKTLDEPEEPETNDAASNPLSDEHLPVSGEIVEEDDQISDEVIQDLGAE
jgi:hypothetical protein